MSEFDAASMYIQKTKQARKTIDRILNWSENMTVKQNAIFLGVQYSWARRLAKKYGLKYQTGH